MTESQIMTLMALIRARYPGNQVVPPTNATDEEVNLAVSTWRVSLEDAMPADVMAALNQWFKVSRFAPDPSELRTKALDLDGNRPRRIKFLQQCVQGDSINAEGLAELKALLDGAPYRPALRELPS